MFVLAYGDSLTAGVERAFAPLTPGWCVPFSYAVAITYVIADTVDKTKKVLDGDKYAELVIMTHEAKEEFINKATLDIKDLDTVKDINNIIRVIG